MDSDTLEARVRKLVADKMAVWPDQLSAHTRLLQDIGVDGTDGWELMEEFGERFGVDLSEFRADLHFGPEGGGDPITPFIVMLFRPRWARFIPITIDDLVATAKSRRWQTPDREPV